MKKYIFIYMILGVLLIAQPILAQTWTATKRLTWTAGTAFAPKVVVDSNNHIHVVWYDYHPGNAEIFYKKSVNGGTTWTTKRLTNTSGFSGYPSVDVNSNNHIHVVWYDDTPGNHEIFHKKSTNGGGSWTTKRLTYNSDDSYYPTIALDTNNHIHVVWHDNTPVNAEIFYKKSTNGGASWTTKRLTYNSDESHSPSIAADSNNHIHVVWIDYTPGNAEIFYKKSTDGGGNWTTKRLTYNSKGSYYPTVAIDSNNHVHIVWNNYISGNSEIYFKKSTNGGASWTTKRLTYNVEDSFTPTIAVDSSSYIHVTWNDYTPGNDEIYYKRSTNGGAIWTTKRLTYNSGNSFSPDIDVAPNNQIHVVWHDYTPGNWAIFYKKGIQ
jgi:hypothetical protein